MSLNVSMKTLLESGVHFGHRTNRWDPRMKPYIFTERNGIHIIDLQQTVQELRKIYDIIRDKIADGGNILFVGTKRQAQETIQMEAERCGMPYVIERWLPGTITNWMTIHQRIIELDQLEKLRDSGEINRLVKKEGLMIERRIKRLLVHLSGIRHMNGVPDMIFIVDINREDTAVHEANLKKIPVIALVDTNCNPENIDHLIPCNDDAIRAIKLMAAKMADAVIEGMEMRQKEEIESKDSTPTLQKLAERKREAEEAAAKAAAKAAEKTAEEAAEESIEEAAEEVAEVTAEEAAEETIEETAEEVAEVIAEETAEEPVEEAAEESIEEVAEEAAEETASDEAPEETDSEDKSK